MQPCTVRRLEHADTQALLAFEVQNREWFESHIDARDPSFYSTQGVAAQIDAYLAGFAAGQWHPFVIEAGDYGIVGRANLKNINAPQGHGEVGYRVDQRFCGQGLATQALKHLIQVARTHWHLQHLVGEVYPGNRGSRIVLERCGFVAAQPPCSEAAQRFTLSL